MNTKHKIILTIISVLLLGTLIVSGCTGAVASRGWAGGAVSDGKLFVASMSGKIIAIDASNGTILGDSVKLTRTSSGGLLSCSGQSTSPVFIFASPSVQGTVVYIGGVDGKIHALSFIDNKLSENRIYPLQGTMNGAVVGEMVIANNTLYFATADGTVDALDTESLAKKWSTKISSKIWSAPFVEGNTLYIGSFDKKVYALNATDGTKLWEYETSGAINSTPIVYDGKVYIGDYDRQFYALDATTGRLVWKFPSDNQSADSPQNWFWAKPLALNGIIYAPCLDGNLYALNASDGSLVKKYVLGDSIASSPVVIGNSIVVATTDLSKNTGKVYTINTLDKSLKELEIFAEGINAPLFANGDVVYVHTTQDNLYGINIITGTKQNFSLSTVK